MNRDDIIRMAKETRFDEYFILKREQIRWNRFIDDLKQFYENAYAEGVADEREACAKLCDERIDAEYATGKVDHNEMSWTQACAIAIRARGEQK